jgi:hypothetical protein
MQMGLREYKICELLFSVSFVLYLDLANWHAEKHIPSKMRLHLRCSAKC